MVTNARGKRTLVLLIINKNPLLLVDNILNVMYIQCCSTSLDNNRPDHDRETFYIRGIFPHLSDGIRDFSHGT